MEKTKYVTYIRVSTKKQSATHLGMDAQRAMCDSYIKSHNGEFIKEFSDVESGKSRTRAGLWGAIDYCKNNDCWLLIAKLDRLSRDVEFTFKIINTGIQIAAADLPVLNTFTLGIFATFSQYEREQISGRTKSSLSAIKDDISKNGGHMSKNGNWIKKLGRAKGCDTSPASSISARNSQMRAERWRRSSPLFLWVEKQVIKRRPRKEILDEAKVLYEGNPSVWCTRGGRPLSEAILSLWIKDMKL